MKSKEEVDQLVSENMSLAYNFANKQREMGGDYENAFSDAQYDLWRAAERHDPELGELSTLFTKYATNRRRGAFKKSNRQCRGGDGEGNTIIATTSMYNDEGCIDVIDYRGQRDIEGAEIVAESLLANLDEREEKIIRMRFGIGTPKQGLKEVGVELGISKERVRQIQEAILVKMRPGLLNSEYSPE